tara:strand:+ start:44 stop:457 length:414 start_codon:yes stop_codon:yes gene_type:complete
MADQDAIQKLSDDLSARVGNMQMEVAQSVLDAVKGKPNAEAIKIINEINIINSITFKSEKLLSDFSLGLTKMLEKKEKFAEMDEDTLLTFFEVARQALVGEMSAMATILKKEIINAVLQTRTIDDILEAVKKQGYGI